MVEESATETASVSPAGCTPERLTVSSGVVDAGLSAPTNLSMAAARPDGERELVVRRQVDRREDDREIWPCVVIRLAGPEAVSHVEDGFEVAFDQLAENLDEETANRAVVLCLADGDEGCNVRGFAGDLGDLGECSVDIV